MTEAGEKWALSKEVPKKDAEDFEVRHIIDDAEFWLRAFCDEVERRAAAKCRHHAVVSDPAPCWSCLGREVRKLKRELLGEESK